MVYHWAMLDDKTKSLVAKRVAKMQNRKLTEEDRDQIAIRFAKGDHPRAIAKAYKISLTTVYKWIARAAQ